METMNINIAYLNKDITKLEYIDGKSDWIDVRAAEDIDFKAGEHKLIPLGFTMQIPDGYEAHLLPRSSTFKNYGLLLTNSMGILDNTYGKTLSPKDEWRMSFYATRDCHVAFNERIGQFRIIKNQPKLNFKEAEADENAVARGGFGSTGKL